MPKSKKAFMMFKPLFKSYGWSRSDIMSSRRLVNGHGIATMPCLQLSYYFGSQLPHSGILSQYNTHSIIFNPGSGDE